MRTATSLRILPSVMFLSSLETLASKSQISCHQHAGCDFVAVGNAFENAIIPFLPTANSRTCKKYLQNVAFFLFCGTLTTKLIPSAEFGFV